MAFDGGAVRSWTGLLATAWLGCGAPAPGASSSHGQAIIGGSSAPSDDVVFAVGNAQRLLCTATLIAPRTLLTAAHCIDENESFTVANPPDVTTWPSNALATVDRRVHPKWDGQDVNYDVGLLLLAQEPPVTPKPWNRLPLRADTVRVVRALGYGDNGLTGSGVRQQATLPVTSVTPQTLHIGGGGASPCFGDSGGPSFHTGLDGVERAVGVHAFSSAVACEGGGDVRLDTVADFIDQWTRDKNPTCSTDGACAVGCSPADLDCFCLTDGACDPRCPLPDTDRDCPRNCLADGICANGTCGKPDPDCLGDGARCEAADQCAGHHCRTDAQHSEPYCSRSCRVNDDCASQMRCAFGVCEYWVLPLATMGAPCTIGKTLCSGGVCAGQTEDTTVCRMGCQNDGSCAGAMKCVSGVRGERYCQGIVILEPVPGLTAEPPRRCAVSDGSPWLLLAAGWLVRRGVRNSRRPQER